MYEYGISTKSTCFVYLSKMNKEEFMEHIFKNEWIEVMAKVPMVHSIHSHSEEILAEHPCEIIRTNSIVSITHNQTS